MSFKVLVPLAWYFIQPGVRNPYIELTDWKSYYGIEKNPARVTSVRVFRHYGVCMVS